MKKKVPDENAAPPRDGRRCSVRTAWPPGAVSPTPSAAAANAAEAHTRRRMEKRHFSPEPGTVGKIIAQEVTDDEIDEDDDVDDCEVRRAVRWIGR